MNYDISMEKNLAIKTCAYLLCKQAWEEKKVPEELIKQSN